MQTSLYIPVCSLIIFMYRTDKKENQIFLIYKGIQSGAVAKYMRKGFLIYEEIKKNLNISPYMRRPLVIYGFATAPPCSFLLISNKFWVGGAVRLYYLTKLVW